MNKLCIASNRKDIGLSSMTQFCSNKYVLHLGTCSNIHDFRIFVEMNLLKNLISNPLETVKNTPEVLRQSHFALPLDKFLWKGEKRIVRVKTLQGKRKFNFQVKNLAELASKVIDKGK